MTDSAPAPITVALDTGPLHGHRTGIGHAVAELSDALAARDDVEVAPYVISGRARTTVDERRLPLPGVAASHIWSRLDLPTADRWLSDVDVVHGTNYVAPPTGHPTVVSVYDCWFLEHPELASPLVRRAGAWLRRGVGRGAWVHCSSAATEAQARRLLATDRTRVVHLGPPPVLDAGQDAPAGIEPGQREPGEREQGEHEPADILAIGTEERRKGYPDLIRAVGELNAQRGPTRLVLAGAHGDDSDAVTAAVESLPPEVAARVRRLGPIDQRGKAALLRSARVVAYPSLDEGFGFPILEAQRDRVPVVARSVGSIPEVAGTGALLVDPGDRFTDRFATALATALDDVELRQQLISAGATNVDRFSWTACATGIVDLYHTAIDAGGTQ